MILFVLPAVLTLQQEWAIFGALPHYSLFVFEVARSEVSHEFNHQSRKVQHSHPALAFYLATTTLRSWDYHSSLLGLHQQGKILTDRASQERRSLIQELTDTARRRDVEMERTGVNRSFLHPPSPSDSFPHAILIRCKTTFWVDGGVCPDFHAAPRMPTLSVLAAVEGRGMEPGGGGWKEHGSMFPAR